MPYIYATILQFCGGDRILDLSFALVQYSVTSTKLQPSGKYIAFVFQQQTLYHLLYTDWWWNIKMNWLLSLQMNKVLLWCLRTKEHFENVYVATVYSVTEFLLIINITYCEKTAATYLSYLTLVLLRWKNIRSWLSPQ